MEKRNVPKLRFKGFEDEWREYKLGKITKLTDGVHSTPEYVNQGVPFWSVETIVSNAKPKFITKEAHRLAIKRCNPQKGDILLTRIGTLAKSKVLENEDELSIYVSVALVKSSSEFKSKFMKQYFDSQYYYKEFLSKSLLTATPKKINMEDLKDTRVKIPSLEEQTKIANFLSNVDNIIEEQEGKVKDLEQYKKGLMQKIFKQEVRFRDENGGEYPEWEEKKFSDIFQNFEYGMNSAAKVFDGINKYIRITDIDDSSNKYISEKKVSPNGKLDNKYLVKENDILFARTGASVGKTYLYDKKDGILYFAGFLIRGNVIKEYDARYIFIETISEKYKRWVKVMSTRSGQPGINSLEYASYKFKCPCLKEQVKIANFLSNIDNIIEEEKKKLEDLKLWKRGLLQQMFV